MKLKQFTGCLVFFISAILFFGCKSFEQPDSVQKPLDYTDQDVIENEINNIHELLKTESTKALFHACLLGNEDVLKECREAVNKEAFEKEDFSKRVVLLKSLQSSGDYSEETIKNYQEALKNMYQDVPGYNVDKAKLPKTTANCIDATVTVWVDQGYKVQNGAGYKDNVIGSGFFIDKRGYIITNHHVIQEVVNPKRKSSCKVYIRLPSDMEKMIPAKVVGYDSVLDLALLKVAYEPAFVFELGDSSALEVGDKISAIGTPIGLEGTITSGIISSTSRSLITIGTVFQIDAAVNAGNSGGPIIDNDRKVQAVVFAGMLDSQGLNFSIPVEYLKQELPLLYAGGEVKHGWLGAYGHTKKYNNENAGLEVQYVIPGSAASYSGFQIGDVIKSIDGVEIKTLEAFQVVCLKYETGTMLNCKVDRDGKLIDVVIYLEKRPASPLKEAFKSDFVDNSFIPIFGMKMTRSSTTNKKLYRIEYVLEGSIADQNGFSENDNLELYDVSFDDENEIFYVVIVVQRRKKGFLDIQMGLGTSYDNPNYF
ncbi:MAG: S1C family serine protease [Treponema sp.]|nr:S1C family serine protease [Treponema sp.]